MDTSFDGSGTLNKLFAPAVAATQAPLMNAPRPVLTAAIATLALGGAEKIVLDWAAAASTRYPLRLIVLRHAEAEWPVPDGVTITRLAPGNTLQQLQALACDIAKDNPTVLCHLLRADERAALERSGVRAIPVLHNAEQGWSEAAATLKRAHHIITVSRAAESQLREARVRAPVSVVRHLPRTPATDTNARAHWRAQWGIPADAAVIGMLGAVKPQKDYPRALRLFAALLEQRDAWLVILGGPVGRDGPGAWYALLATARRLGIEHRLRVPGFVAIAAACLPAFDLLLNTSAYEGLSISTLEALAAGLPCVVSAVGGQGEVSAPGLTLIDGAASDPHWLAAITIALKARHEAPSWRGFPAHRQWTLFHLPLLSKQTNGVLLVTANLNAGGAQRSLVNLACALNGEVRLEVAVCGDSSSSCFSETLQQQGVAVRRTASSRDCFDHAEELCNYLFLRGFSAICLWNVDAKVKLLLVKALQHTRVRLIDVSPGGYAFEELDATADFQQWIAFDQTQYYTRLDALVLKFKGDAPQAARRKTHVIPNGVPLLQTRARVAHTTTRIVVSGRIAPSKFLLEIVAAMKLLWRVHPAAELHVLGSVETRHVEYGARLLQDIGDDLNRRVYLHGPCLDAPQRVAEYDIALVLGEHQGCPNTVLEALAAGVPVVANDSGGTREQIIHERTGLLLQGTSPQEAAQALARLIGDPTFARRMAANGQRHVAKHFSMARMARAYRKLFRA